MNKHNLLKQIGYMLLLALISVAAFWRVLSFGFWIDDWPLSWATFYNLSFSLRFYNHPGLPIQFLLLTPVFGVNTTAWMVYGLVIKIIVAFFVGLFFKYFANSKLIGFLAGLFFAVSYAGFEILVDPAANTAGIIAIPMLVSLILFIKALQKEKKFFIWSGFFLFIAFLLDPARVIPVFFILPLLFFFFPKTKANIFWQKVLLKIYLITGIMLIPLLLFYFVRYEYDSQIAHALVGFVHKPLFILSKLNRFGNLFASVANLFTGTIYSMRQDEMNTGFYERIFGVTGVALFLISIFGFWHFFKQKSKAWGMVGFLLFWTFIFYLPNFLSEPRAPMAGPHRYLFLSSIGFVGLVAYLLNKIHTRWVVVLLSGTFIVLNIYKANTLLTWQATYRSDAVIDHLWNTVIHDVGTNKTNDIFIFTGKNPWVWQDLEMPGAWAFLLKEKMNVSPSKFPVVTTDQKSIVPMLCGKTLYVDTRKKAFTKDKVQLSHVYSWDVKAPGVLVNTSEKTREYFEKLMGEKCTTKIQDL